MSKLSLKTQNKMGGNPLWKSDLGYTAIFPDNEDNAIIADAFQGYGKDYKRRNSTQIVISKGSEHYTFDSFDSLFSHLKKTMK